MKQTFFAAVCCLCIAFSAFAFQEKHAIPEDASKVIVAPGARYNAGAFHQLFFGSHWRNLWTTPVEVEVLDLDSFAGGLRPLKRGGGHQTKSLRFEGKDGRQYKFRSLDKDPRLVLPEELRQSIAAEILQDQISSSNPLSALIVPPLLNKLGILNAEPRLVLLPDNDRMGEFQPEFGGMLGTLEENPNEGPDGEPGFAGAEKIVGTFTLFDRLEKDHDEQVDAREFLKARLVDVFLGDWDRHVDQWRWAGFRNNNGWIWKPIPRDRDQAFARFTGLLPWFTTVYVTQLEPFGDDYPDLEDLTWAGRFLDRRLLVSLEKAVWDSLATFIQEKLSDSVIEDAVRQLSSEMYAKEGKTLEQTLKSRRSALKEASDEFYRFNAQYVDVRASDKGEVAEITRLDDQKLMVELFERDKQTGKKEGEPFSHRVFDSRSTCEVRVYMLGGNDSVTVKGNVNSSINVIVVGGEGNDAFIDASNVNGYFLSFVPVIPSSERKTHFYDSGSLTLLVPGSGTTLHQDQEIQPKTELEKYEPSLRDYGDDWKFDSWLNINPDDGLFVGGGPQLYKFDFRTVPYTYDVSLRAGYATFTHKVKLDFNAHFYSTIKGASVSLYLLASQLEIINYFGRGNDTRRSENLEEDGYYKAHLGQYLVRPQLEIPLSSTMTLLVGGLAEFSDVDIDAHTYIADARPYGAFNLSLAALQSGFRFDGRDNTVAPTSGIFAQFEGSLFPRVFNNSHRFGNIKADVRTYLFGNVFNPGTLALRVAGEKLWGTYPFYKSAFIGGITTIRGYEKQRFAGDASLFGNAELRLPIAHYMALVPQTVGISLFGETGRVFLSGEQSDRWHGAIGGGLWFSFVRSDYTVSLSLARSPEQFAFYATAGFTF